MASILEARDVSFAYGEGTAAIHEMSFALESPRRVALLGANGVGKSTLMLLLNGTLRPLHGELIVLGRAIDYSRPGLQWLHRKVGIVLQDPVKMGHDAVMTLVRHLEKLPVEKRIPTGEHVATPENMDEPEMHKLLNPQQFGE